MKLAAKLLTAMAIVGLSISCSKKVGKLETTKQKFSYTIGQQIGQNLKTQNIDIDTEILAASIEEALSGKESRLSPEDMQKVLQDVQKELLEKRQAESGENLEEGAKFLEANKAKEGVKSTDSGLQYMVEKEGEGASPSADDTVEVHYKGTLINGEEFDSSYTRNQTAKFPVKGVIPGWTEGLQLMKKGAKYKFFIPADLAYGERGRPGIPPNSTLIFEVELIDIPKGDAE